MTFYLAKVKRSIHFKVKVNVIVNMYQIRIYLILFDDNAQNHVFVFLNANKMSLIEPELYLQVSVYVNHMTTSDLQVTNGGYILCTVYFFVRQSNEGGTMSRLHQPPWSVILEVLCIDRRPVTVLRMFRMHLRCIFIGNRKMVEPENSKTWVDECQRQW